MNIAAFADAVRDLVYLDLKTGAIDRNSDNTFLLIRGPADFAEEVTRLLDEHRVLDHEYATDAQLDRAREALPCKGIQIDDDAIVCQGHEADGVWLSAWLWLPDQIARPCPTTSPTPTQKTLTTGECLCRIYERGSHAPNVVRYTSIDSPIAVSVDTSCRN